MVKFSRSTPPPRRPVSPLEHRARRGLRPLLLVSVLGLAPHLAAAPRLSGVHVEVLHDRFRLQELQKPQNPDDGMPDPDAEVASLAAQEDKLKDNFTMIPRTKLMALQVATVVGWGVFLLLWMVGRSRRNFEQLDPPQD